MRGQNRSGCGNTRDEVSRESLSGCRQLGWAYRLSRNELLTDTHRAASLPGTRAQGCRGTFRELWGDWVQQGRCSEGAGLELGVGFWPA